MTITADIDANDLLKRLRDLEASQQVTREQVSDIRASLIRIETMLTNRESRFDGITTQLVELKMGQTKACADADTRAMQLENDVEKLRQDFDNFVGIVKAIGLPLLMSALFSIIGLVWALVTHKITLSP